jgi:glycosyltransferase involved in cell wall biosynthesis
VLAGMGGLSINDAMIFGLPVVCSVCDGTEKKLVKEGVNGVFFEEGNQEDLAEKIIYLLNHPSLIGEMGVRSTQIIQNEINIHTVLKGYLDCFSYVMASAATGEKPK